MRSPLPHPGGTPRAVFARGFFDLNLSALFSSPPPARSYVFLLVGARHAVPTAATRLPCLP